MLLSFEPRDKSSSIDARNRCHSKRIAQYVDAPHDKDKTNDEIEAVLELGADTGARYYLVSDPNGEYELMDSVYKTKAKGEVGLVPIEKDSTLT